jgi:hypothetical protein
VHVHVYCPLEVPSITLAAIMQCRVVYEIEYYWSVLVVPSLLRHVTNNDINAAYHIPFHRQAVVAVVTAREDAAAERATLLRVRSWLGEA